MKINKRNPAHWIYLICFAANVAFAMLLRPFCRARDRPLVLLYGHKLNGNLRSLYDVLKASADGPCEVRVLSMDPVHYRELIADGIAAELAVMPRAALALARVRCIVSDHGLHVMAWLPRLSNIRFIDVWHGIPFKGWSAEDFRTQHGYDELWVSSELIRRFYLQRFGFREHQVVATGYGRTDRLVQQCEDTRPLLRELGVPAGARVVLFAPTWQHGTPGHSIFPFGVEAEDFLACLATVCAAHHAVCLFRTHLNSALPALRHDGPFRAVPTSVYPDAEAVLLASDILVCDWSSIAFDFLVLKRPTIFLDVPHPFPKGLTLGPEYRYGAVVADLATLAARLDEYLTEPQTYHAAHGQRAAEVLRAVYDDNADGRAAERYRARLLALLGTAERA